MKKTTVYHIVYRTPDGSHIEMDTCNLDNFMDTINGLAGNDRFALVSVSMTKEAQE